MALTGSPTYSTTTYVFYTNVGTSFTKDSSVPLLRYGETPPLLREHRHMIQVLLTKLSINSRKYDYKDNTKNYHGIGEKEV